jgi:hypothetical protein
MFTSALRFVGVVFAVAAVTAPVALGSPSTRLSPADVSRLGARTEAVGFTAITRYLVEGSSAADTAALGARSEAKGYRALIRYQEQQAASGAERVQPSSRRFAWGDALAGAGLTAGVFLLGAAAALMVRRRQVSARIRN